MITEGLCDTEDWSNYIFQSTIFYDKLKIIIINNCILFVIHIVHD